MAATDVSFGTPNDGNDVNDQNKPEQACRPHTPRLNPALLQNPWVRQGEIPLVAFEGQEAGQG
jgi:hypothetical protein